MTGEKKKVPGRRNMPGRQFDSNGWDNESLESLSAVERQIVNSKMFLMTQTNLDQPSLYDHLSRLITKILEDKPENIDKEFEDLSRYLKTEKLSSSTSLLRTPRIKTPTEIISTAQLDLLQKASKFQDVKPEDSEEEPKFQGIPNIMRQAAFFEAAGVGLPREDFVRITLALRDLVDQYPNMQFIRFWGKVLGTTKNYFVAEVEFAEGDYESEVDETDEELNSVLLEEDSSSNMFDDRYMTKDYEVISEAVCHGEVPRKLYLLGSVTDFQPLKRPPKIPCEVPGTGLNKKVFFVCTERGARRQSSTVVNRSRALFRRVISGRSFFLTKRYVVDTTIYIFMARYKRTKAPQRGALLTTGQTGLPWTRLPHVTPAQIQVARKIRRFFTGDLNAPVVTHPPFPGIERNYLRAQIARISACTHVSPLGYFRFDDEGEEEEEIPEEAAASRSGIVQDLEFEGFSVRDLADSSLQTWVHHAPAILPQGRITWYNPVGTKEVFNEEGEEEEEEERNEPDEPEPEVGPPLLTPLAEDENVGESPSWITCTSSKFVPEYAVAVLQSNVWVGAMAFAADKGKFFENIYIGWGHKNLGASFEPALPDEPLTEFPSGPEVTEADDPTPEEEAAVRAALQEKELEAEFEQNIDHDEGDDDDDIVDDDGEGGDQFDED